MFICFYGMQLEAGSATNPYNLLENSGFEKSSSPTHWNMISTDSDDAVSSDSYFKGTRALRVTGKPGVERP